MGTTFLTTLRINLREKSSLFWLFCFPILLSTMFLGMFGNLDATYAITTMRFAVVADDAYCKADDTRALLAAMQHDPITPASCAATPAAQEAADVDSGGVDLRDLLELTAVDDTREAIALINRDDDVRGFISVDDDGLPHMTISRATVSNASDAMSSPGLPVSLSILNGAIGMFNRQTLTLEQIMHTDPSAFASPSFTAAVGESPDFTRQVRLTNFKPDEGARYYYALLAMTALMAMTFAVTTVCSTQANLSALGMRRSLAPLTRFKQLMGGFLASWLCTFCSLVVTLLYIHFVCRISFGGRWTATLLAIVVASFTANALGTLLGSLPKLTAGAKIGLTTAFSCALSLLSGLYGSGAMALSDWIQRNMPVVATINPTQQVTNLFYDILYYDSYTPFFRTVGILLTMAVLALALATVFLRRQRYAHL
ncbi:ABC transporter permease [Bifidobacterium sp. AGR2158]|uniref:ABC transporter permease n=1 Tax=Bifidobacterium sp. AGR2158 TaxID=1280675 RepID=UPI000425C17E|nr:ABC transporter permease [Bifidobacterium sp. AGR2158]